MKVNALPRYDDSVNTTGCCPKFNPDGWDDRHLHFESKKFLRATTRSFMHVPLNMDRVFRRVQGKLQATGTYDPDNTIVLSRDLSPWIAEHLFAVDQDIEGEEMVTLSGDFDTKVFEGPYRQAKQWHDEMEADARRQGREPGAIYFFYTSCPKCAKAYGRNYVVGVSAR